MKLFKNLLLTTTTIFFIACGDNTTQSITSDIDKLSIDEKMDQPTDIYSTDEMKLHASVSFKDSTTDDATNSVKWVSSNYDIMNQYYSTSLPVSNSGDANITASYGEFNDTIQLHIIGLTDINNSWSIVSRDINSTGDFILKAEGNFSDGVNNKEILRNISWYSSNLDDTIVVDDDYTVTITIDSTGERNITARLFDNNETDKVLELNIPLS